jgi:hypothetical protein
VGIRREPIVCLSGHDDSVLDGVVYKAGYAPMVIRLVAGDWHYLGSALDPVSLDVKQFMQNAFGVDVLCVPQNNGRLVVGDPRSRAKRIRVAWGGWLGVFQDEQIHACKRFDLVHQVQDVLRQCGADFFTEVWHASGSTRFHWGCQPMRVRNEY